ncbi:hypothetical protein XCR_4539 [Xanthomonas campestris pv. raphani 756C]|nr:hypothetical protein XCR_4539 [Xanthomonas campestris pv. raphani 756C]
MLGRTVMDRCLLLIGDDRRDFNAWCRSYCCRRQLFESFE